VLIFASKLKRVTLHNIVWQARIPKQVQFQNVDRKEKKKDKAFQSIPPHTKKFPLKSSKNISFFDKRNIIKNAKRSQVHREYARGASKTEKKKEQENYES
jgi:hypothetical protein